MLRIWVKKIEKDNIFSYAVRFKYENVEFSFYNMENIHHFSQAYFLFLHIWSKFLKKCCVYAEKSSDKATFAVP